MRRALQLLVLLIAWGRASSAASQVSSPPIQFQNSGTPIGVAFTFNCSTGTSCSIINGAVVITSTTGGGATAVVNPSGAADQVNINAAYSAVSAAGGGTIYLSSGVYHLTACLQPLTNVSLIGVKPNLTGFDGQSNDYWTRGTGGTWLVGDGGEVGFCFNNTVVSNPATYLTVNALRHVTIQGMGMTNFTRAFDIGAQNNPGLYFSRVEDIYVYGCSDWGFHFENFSEDYFVNLFSVSNTTGDMWFASSVNVANYEPGNSHFMQIYSSPLNNQARGIVFAAQGAESNNNSKLNSIKAYNLQVNRFRDTLSTQTITPSNASTSISVTDLTQFKVGLPFFVTSTADGYTTNQMYFVLSVSGSSGAGTITAGNSPTTAAITANNNTALTEKSYGFAGIEIQGSQSTNSASTVNATLFGLDLETGSSTMTLFDEEGVNNTYQIASTVTPLGPSSIVLRASGSPTIIEDNSSAAADIDSSSSRVMWNGSRGTMVQRQPFGIYFDSVINAPAWTISNITGNSPDFYLRSPAGNFVYPNNGIGVKIHTQDTTLSMNGNNCGGEEVFNGASGQTFTLPAIDNASTKASSYQGCHIIIVNASTANTLTVSTSSSQTFNNVAAKTSTTMAINSRLDVVASTTGSGSVLFWAAEYTTAGALP